MGQMQANEFSINEFLIALISQVQGPVSVLYNSMTWVFILTCACPLLDIMGFLQMLLIPPIFRKMLIDELTT